MNLALLCAIVALRPVQPLPAAHAHNDYLHARPLLDALDYGFCSIEADIFRVGNKLLVAHERASLNPERELARLYLNPLQQKVRAGGGRVYSGGPPITLLLDIKADGEAVYALLRQVLPRYRGMLTEVRHGRYIQRAVTVVLSGCCPREAVLKDKVRFAAIDGRLPDLGSSLPAHAMPIISDQWIGNFRWFGIGTMPASERQRLQDVVTKAHAAGRRVRFWATPDSEPLWEELLGAGVDLIGTHNLSRLASFLRGRP